MSASQALQRLYSLDPSSSEFLRTLYKFTRLDENGEFSFNLQQSESARLADFLDGALDYIPLTDALFRRCLRRLRQVCGYHKILPSSHIISVGLRVTSQYPVAFGGFADVWEGMLGSEKVCVKMLRDYNMKTDDQKQALSPFYGEAVVWKRLKHPNVVPFLGVTTGPLQLVSRWMPNGTLTEYVNSKPHANRISLLLDVAEGLNYLHNCHMVHGDLKGPNILIDGSGSARVCDFGLASIAYGKYTTGLKSDKGHTARWSAPEILFGECITSRQADIFAFGMVVVETFTGNVPFHTIISSAVTWKLMNGDRPPRPYEACELGLTDPVWKMTESCWQQPPEDRLRAFEVVDLLREMYAVPSGTSSLDTISVTPGPVESGSTTPQTGAPLSPRLLDILQYREPPNKRAIRTMSDTTPLNNERRIVTSGLSERPTSAPVYWPSGQHGGDGIIQRFGVVGQAQEDPSLSTTSVSVSTIGNESWHTTETTFYDPINSNNSSEPAKSTPIPSESKIAVPKITIQVDDFVPSGSSSSAITDGSDRPRPTLADSGAKRKAKDVRSSGRLENEKDGNGRGDNDARKISSIKKPGPAGQRPGRPPLPTRASEHGPQAFPSSKADRDPAIPDPKPLWRDPAPSRGSSLGRNGSRVELLARQGPGGASSKPSTRPSTRPPTRSSTPAPTLEGGNPKDREGGGESRPSDVPPQKTGAPRKATGRWGSIRAVAKVLGLHKRHLSQSGDAESGN